MRSVQTKVQTAMHDYDAIVAAGLDNFTYLTGVVLPFATNYPDRKALVVKTKDKHDAIICPFDWSDCIREQGWKGTIAPYDENTGTSVHPVIRTLAEVVGALRLTNKRVGLDKSRVSKSFALSAEQALPEIKWLSCDMMLGQLRILKTKDEVDLLETAAKHSELGIVFALNHLEGALDSLGYTIAEFTERVRVHVYESGGSGVGHLATLQGSEGHAYYVPQRGRFRTGEVIRIDVTNHHRGYWSNAGRMAVTGCPTEDQAAAYKDNLALKAAAQSLLKPGVRSKDIFEEVAKTARQGRIRFWDRVPVGHGAGTSDREPPYLGPQDQTVLELGMVIALDIYTFGPRQELIHSKDTYEIVEDGSRLLSWYRSWDRLYEVMGFRSTH